MALGYGGANGVPRSLEGATEKCPKEGGCSYWGGKTHWLTGVKSLSLVPMLLRKWEGPRRDRGMQDSKGPVEGFGGGPWRKAGQERGLSPLGMGSKTCFCGRLFHIHLEHGERRTEREIRDTEISGVGCWDLWSDHLLR